MSEPKRKRPARPKPAAKNKKPKRATTKTSWKAGESGNPETKWEKGCESPNPTGNNQWGGKDGLYRPEYAETAKELCENGATRFDLADHFGVAARTIDNWTAKHTAFREALNAGREAFDELIERSLGERARGYYHEVEKVWQWQGQIVRATVVEHVPADPGAAAKWLAGRRASKWGDKQAIELTGKDGGPIETSSKSDLEIAQRIAFALAKAARAKDAERMIEHNE